jgi:ATP/maltotriose-dependent transcriptional regulator MalT
VAHRAAAVRAAAPDDDGDPAGQLSVAHALLGEWDGAAAGLAVAVPAMRLAGRISRASEYLGWWALASLGTGDWDRALSHGAEAEQLAVASGDPVLRLRALGHQAWAFALRGQAEQAESLAARMTADPHASSYFRSVAQRALGLSALSTGRPAEAFDLLARLFDPADPVHHYGLQLPALDDLAAAARECGRLADARAIVARLERPIEATAAPSVRTGLMLARVLLADDEQAGALLSAALQAGPSSPYQRGRLQLAYGSLLRRQRRHAQARVPLRHAAENLERLGAGYWAEQARSELRAAGEPRPAGEAQPGQDQGPALLSAQELRIAGLAASGLSNREIAAALTLSPRTVGAHLYRVFPKLGVTSRVQLAAALATR